MTTRDWRTDTGIPDDYGNRVERVVAQHEHYSANLEAFDVARLELLERLVAMTVPALTAMSSWLPIHGMRGIKILAMAKSEKFPELYLLEEGTFWHASRGHVDTANVARFYDLSEIVRSLSTSLDQQLRGFKDKKSAHMDKMVKKLAAVATLLEE